MPSASVHLFVYGSLKRGGRHHDELTGATFLGEAETGPGYRLEPLGEYLAMVAADVVEGALAAAATVSGELFEVPQSKLPDLDAFEGDAYVRSEVSVRIVVAEGEGREKQEGEGREKERQGQAQERGNWADSAGARFALAYLRKAR